MLLLNLLFAEPLLPYAENAVYSRSLPLLNKIDNTLQKVPYSKSVIIGSGVVGIGYWGLKTTPITNRKKFVLLPVFLEQFIGNVVYKVTYWGVKKSLLSNNDPEYLRVSRVVNRLLLKNSDRLPKLNFTLHVINQANVNAFVLPNGKIFVYKGILKVATTDEQLAAVLGHEIGHVLGRHFAEKQTFAVIMEFIVEYQRSKDDGIVKGIAEEFTKSLLNLKYSRDLEYEADIIGLHLMTAACYDPKGAVEVWQNFANIEKFGVIEFMSTHPSNINRMQYLKTKTKDVEGWERLCAAT